MSRVLDQLRDVRRLLAGRRAAGLVLGVAALVAALFGGAALAARLGALGIARWMPLAIWVAALGAAGWCAWRLRALLRAPTARVLRETASLVEGELALRRGALVGLVDLAGGAPAGMSPALATQAAVRMTGALPAVAPAWAPASSGRLGRRMRLLGLAAGSAVVAAALSFRYAGEAAAVLISPVRALRAAASPRLTLSVSARAVPRGGAVAVRLRTLPQGRPVLYVRATGEGWRPFPLRADLAGIAVHRLRDVRTALFLYAARDGAVTDTVKVDVVAPPFVAEFAVTARYPAYLARADEPLVLEAGPAALPVGTALLVRGTASARLTRAGLVAGADTVGLTVRAAVFEGQLVVRGTAAWRLALVDGLGAAVPEPLPVFEVRAVPDSAPRVSVPVPGGDTTAPLDLQPALVVDARDDHGLGRIDVVSWRVSRLGLVGDTVVDSLPGVNGADRVVQSHLLDLTARGLLPGDTLRYFVRATDRAPAAHTGRSREYVLRLRSMSELRNAVREGADSLAAAAQSLAADQSALTRRTEDLAAQRNRAADRAAPREGAREPSGDRAPPPGAMPFEQAEEARRIADRQAELAARADSLRRELDRVVRAAEDAGLTDPAWREQLRNLEELMRQAVTPEMQQRLEELRRALERLDPQAVQQALRSLTEEQRRLREELQRSAELFERAALEGSMQTLAQNAEVLRQQQERWNRESAIGNREPGRDSGAAARADSAAMRRDSAAMRRDSAAAAEERRLQAGADTLRRQLRQLAERLAQRGDSVTGGAVSGTADSAGRASGEMEEASGAMEQGERRRAAQRGRAAAEALREVPDALRRSQQRMSQAWRAEVLRAMEDATSETIALAAEEQRLAEQLRRGEGSADARGRQSAMEQGVGQVARRLQQAAGRNALVNPRLGTSLAQAREAIGRSREALEGTSPRPEEAAENAGNAARVLARAAFQMMRNRDDIAGSQSGSGMAEAIERMAAMAGQQGQLNDELGGLLPMLGNGTETVLMRLRELAARQRALANDLERMGDAGLPGRPEQLADEARALADRLDQARLDRGTLERQQRLFRRMLDAGRTLRNNDDEEDPERRSNTAVARAPRVPGTGTPTGPGLRYPVPPWSALRDLAPAERALVLDYFRRLNAQR